MPVKWVFLLVILYAGSTYATDNDTDKQAKQQPDVDFLEFLGEWETTDGAWFDPLPGNENKPGDSQHKEQQDEKS